jgi:hypothetical protein
LEILEKAKLMTKNQGVEAKEGKLPVKKIREVFRSWDALYHNCGC